MARITAKSAGLRDRIGRIGYVPWPRINRREALTLRGERIGVAMAEPTGDRQRGSDSMDPTQAESGPSSRSDTRSPGGAVPIGIIRIAVIVAMAESEIDQGLSAPMSVETTAALARLGDPVEILRAGTPAELSQLLEDPSIDLVLVDRVEPEDTQRWLGGIPANGPPSVVVVSEAEDEAALEAFRAGASDCVRFGPDYESVLPVVLLEQVRRWRADRQQRVSRQRIRWLEDLYAGIVSEMPAALAVVDSEGLIVAVNQEFDRLFPRRSAGGETTAEVLEARLPAELVDAAYRGRSAAGASAIADRGQPGELVRVDGIEGGGARAYELRRRHLDDQGREVLLISDVTESEWLSKRLEALRRDTRGIIENINSALLVVNLAGRISFANPAAESILGGSAHALVGREIADWFGHGGEEVSPIEECLERGTRSRGAETLLRRADGHWIPVGVSCSPRLDGEGRKNGVVAVFQDLSEVKELELHVRQTEKMASIGQLAAGVAHEVNNPMGFIHANLHQMAEYLSDLNKVFDATGHLQKAVAEGDLEAIRAASEDVTAVSREVDLDYVRTDFDKALHESVEGAERIRHIVRDLRDFSRPDLPARSPADVNQAVDSTANIVWAMMKHSVHLEKEYGDLPKIDAYPMQLKQVFMNLLVNAYQAIEEKASPESGIIRIETEHCGDEIVVRIIDSGIGIGPDVQSRIFEPFYTTKPVGAGTGLGLSTSYSIIERHGGRLSVASNVGEGTTFEVRLPTGEVKDDAREAEEF
jgi:two-component system, NtrC family, sensor kinase